jgi:hypothetical protein
MHLITKIFIYNDIAVLMKDLVIPPMRIVSRVCKRHHVVFLLLWRLNSQYGINSQAAYVCPTLL